MFELAKQWGYLEETGKNPAHGVTKFKEEKRDRYVTLEELPLLAVAIKQARNIYVQYAILLYLLTGLRKNELLKARWDDIDWSRRELCIRDNKSDCPHYVALSSPALELLQVIPHQQDNTYIIPGAKAGQHLVNIDKPWR